MSVGAERLKRSVADSSLFCAMSIRRWNAGISHSCTAPGGTGTIQPAVRAINAASGSGTRANPRTPSARRIGGRFDPAAAKYAASGARAHPSN